MKNPVAFAVVMLGPVVAIAAVVGWQMIKPEGDIRRVASFTSERRDKVIAYETRSDVSRGKALGVMLETTATPGRVTVVVVYGPDHPAPIAALNAAPDLMAALQVVADGWDHRRRVNPAGQQTLD